MRAFESRKIWQELLKQMKFSVIEKVACQLYMALVGFLLAAD
jgi:phenylalanine-4-hydroxylase